ncbi:hypothetical protein ABT299_15865 [Spirillospora sp. NPDC000708]
MTEIQILSLFLAVSVALNIAFCAALLVYRSGMGTSNAVISGAGAAATGLGIYFAAVGAYH